MKIKIFKIRLSEEFLIADQNSINDFLAEYEVLHTNSQFIENNISYWSVLITYQEKRVKSKITKSDAPAETELSDEEEIIFGKLKNWRSEKAKQTQLPAYVIFHNSHLVSIAKHKPNNIEDLENVTGIGKLKTEKYGAEIIGVLENA